MFTIAIWQRERNAEMKSHQSKRQSLLEKVFRGERHFENKSRWGRSDWDHEADKLLSDEARRGDLDYWD